MCRVREAVVTIHNLNAVKGRDTSFKDLRLKDASSKGRIVQGSLRPRDASSQGTHRPRDAKSKAHRILENTYGDGKYWDES
jgi:hypothetical protein